MADLPPGKFWKWLGSSPESPTILAFHGFGGSGQDFEPVAKALDHLGLNWIAPRLSAFTPRHAHFPDEEPYLLREEFLRSIHQIIKECGVKKLIVMGYSIGGRIALQYTLCHQESVRGLILIGATPGIRDASLMLERRELEEEWIDRIDSEGVVAFQNYWQTLPVVASQVRIPEEIKEAIRNRRRAALPRELIFSLKLFGQGVFPALWDNISELEIPALLVAGADDEKYLELAQEMQKEMKHGTVEAISSAGHMAHLENTPAFANCCEKFINKLVSEK